jgi:hypothetical protein
MLLTVETKNSVYEIDTDAKQIRRVNGVNPPTSSQEADLLWKPYTWLIGPELGQSMLYSYYQGPPTKAVQTSVVTAITKIPNAIKADVWS